MAISSRLPSKLNHATHSVPSGAAARVGESSCRNSWPTATAVISPPCGSCAELCSKGVEAETAACGRVEKTATPMINSANREASQRILISIVLPKGGERRLLELQLHR